MSARWNWFLAGVFLVTLTTLTLEILNTRLLSVMTWYHLSFFAVSTAMFGMAAGAIRVYLGKAEFEGAAAPAAMARYATYLAISIPLCHIVNLAIPIPAGTDLPTILATAVTAVILSIPFFLSGVVVAIALTRIPGPSGLIYAIDLGGAALGSLAVLLFFEFARLASAMFVVGSVAALGAACLHHFAGSTRLRVHLALAVALGIAGGVNDLGSRGISTIWSKGQPQLTHLMDREFWTVHGQVVVTHPMVGSPFFGSKAAGVNPQPVSYRRMLIDGVALTVMTDWDGQDASIEWIGHDLTSLPYVLRKGGNNAVIGVGGGRDLLTALWGESESVRGVEINEAFIELLEQDLREYASLAGDPRVELIHDEARSYMTRTPEKFDVLQMSLIDTWAATGAGAFTLSENGLYTIEAWTTFLDRLQPGGLLSVSRFYSAHSASETSRLVSLATASLLASGAERPEDHMILAARHQLATLVVSNEPLSPADLSALDQLDAESDLKVLLAPHRKPADRTLGQIAASRSVEEIGAAAQDPCFDYSPPTDERPYFFNILKPSCMFSAAANQFSMGVIGEGNVLATKTLLILWMVVFALVVLTIIGPLVASGLPRMDSSTFAVAILYFSLIGLGFMFVQIPLMQRFSVYLGHPTYALAVILFSMILATGIGSFFSDRLAIEARPHWARAIPLVIAGDLLVLTFLLQPIIDSTIQFQLIPRILVTTFVVGVAALPLGVCFPMGLRLVRRISEDAMPWMWGVNGAAGVLASVTAVAVSMWMGIAGSLYLATASYALLLLPAAFLWQRGAAKNP